jgi:hypothetical protein
LLRYSWFLKLLLACLLLLPSSATQSSAEADRATVSTYVAFFRQVAQLQSLSEHPESVMLPPKMRMRGCTIAVPRIQDVVGLSDHETGLLLTSARACLAGIDRRVQSPVVFEARMEELEGSGISESVARQVSELKQRYDDQILGHVQQLRSNFGPTRFQVLDEYVRTSKWQSRLSGQFVCDRHP